ncbi:MAG: hypothetical protein GF341_12065 [candidate division Zixibacteria bacterium]|nr:hypothetical protein [candidate division Zixibacteria bacterium]
MRTLWSSHCLTTLVLIASVSISTARIGEATDGSAVTQAQADSIMTVYASARNTPDLDRLDQIYHPDVVVHDCSAPGDIRGLDSLKSYYLASHAGIPDFQITIDDTFLSSDYLIVRWTASGTHRGSLRGLPPTEKQVNFSGVTIDLLVNGKIAEEWVYFNVLDLMQQLGFTLTPPSVANESEK